MFRSALAALAAFSFLAAPADAQCFVNSDLPGAGLSLFGRAVAVDGDYALVSAPLEETVRAYERINGVWQHTQTLNEFESFYSGQSFFGQALALDGNIAAIGAPAWGGDDTGAFGIYRRVNGQWEIEDTITGPVVGEFNTDLGVALAIDGNTIYAGSVFGTDQFGLFSTPARVRIFEFIDDEWRLTSIAFGDPTGSTGFARSIAAEGDVLVIGTPFVDVPDPMNPLDELNLAGGVEVIETIGGATVRTSLQPDVPEQLGAFGRDVAVDGGRLFITGSRRIHVFEKIAGVWTQTDDFGHASWIDVAGGRIYSSAAVDGDNGLYVYEETPSGWTEVSYTFLNDDPFPAEFILAADGDALVLGEPRNDTFGPESGAAHFYNTATVGDTLVACEPDVSVASPDAVTLDIRGGADRAGLSYLVLGSITGTAPGVPLGGITIPLNVDSYFLFTANNPNTPLLANSAGTLDIHGQAQPAFQLPAGLPPVAIGLLIDHAAVIFDGAPSLATNPVTTELLP